jgi:hypothetical protein
VKTADHLVVELVKSVSSLVAATLEDLAEGDQESAIFGERRGV